MIPALPPHRAGPPAWTLLDTDAYMDDTQNATTATACTSTGQPIQVTLVAAEPPRASFFCVSCPCLKKEPDEDDEPFSYRNPLRSTVLYSEGDLALLCVPLSAG
ncbi:hypothetical protein PR202_gb18809 [Eleusine coracana subsp. coracana]|uniref:Uncharacterized protein n=1 Tax=Eleusine coracana subsp. coracana TaxID=191504 RepID=A0AAV5F6D2_ELECO|nr:hypothetical protein PR202_gb18809 [Eleusine coracana subsp. coracana]